MAGKNNFHKSEPKSSADKKSVARAVIAKGPDKQGGVDPHGSNPSAKGPLGKLRHIHIEPAKNGYTVRTSHESTGDGKAMPFDGQDQQHVFNDHHSMLKHITKALGCDDEDGEGEYA